MTGTRNMNWLLAMGDNVWTAVAVAVGGTGVMSVLIQWLMNRDKEQRRINQEQMRLQAAKETQDVEWLRSLVETYRKEATDAKSGMSERIGELNAKNDALQKQVDELTKTMNQWKRIADERAVVIAQLTEENRKLRKKE